MQCSYLSCHYFAMPNLQFIGTCCSRFGFCCCLDAAAASSASGSRNHRTALYCRQAAFHCNRSTEIHFGGSAPPSLLSGNSVLRAGFGSGRSTLPRLVSVFQRFCAGHARGEPSAELHAARVRRTVADSASSCCGLQISVNLQSCPVRPSIAFSGVRLIRAHAVTGCPVGLEIQ